MVQFDDYFAGNLARWSSLRARLDNRMASLYYICSAASLFHVFGQMDLTGVKLDCTVLSL
jgi:hypothetical protein